MTGFGRKPKRDAKIFGVSRSAEKGVWHFLGKQFTLHKILAI